MARQRGGKSSKAGKAKAKPRRGAGRSKGRASGRASDSGVDYVAVRRTATIALMLLLGGGLAVGALVGVGRLETRLAEHRASEGVEIVIEWPPATAQTVEEAAGEQEEGASGPATWLPATFRDHLHALAVHAAGEGESAYETRALRRVAEAMGESGWFRGTPRASRERGGRIVVRGRWRWPLAVVEHRGSSYVLAADGGVLPVRFVEDMPEEVRRVIRNPESGPAMRGDGRVDMRRPWPGQDVHAGLELIALLAREPFWPQVAGVDVGEFLAHDRLVILTDQGSRVVWGGEPGTYHPGEPSDEDKLARLRHLYGSQQFGRRIDAGRDRLEIHGPKVLIDDTPQPIDGP